MASEKEQRSGTANGAASGLVQLRRFYLQYAVIGAIAFAGGVWLGVAVEGTTRWLATSLAMGFGAFFLGLGVWGLRVGSASPALAASFNLVQSGRLAEASARLDAVGEKGAPTVVMSVHHQRALIALRRGDLASTRRELDRVLGVRPGMLLRKQAEALRTSARGLRAWVLAASGEVERARYDVEAVRAASAPAVDALAHAALAEAVILQRSGDRAGLGELLRERRRLLMGGLDVRERAVVRAMQRQLRTAAASVYRVQADPDKHLADEQEPPISEWLGRIAPDLAAFMPRTSRRGGRGEAREEEVERGARRLPRGRDDDGSKTSDGGARLPLLWGALSVGFVAAYQLLQSHSALENPASGAAAANPWTALWGVGLFGILSATYAAALSRNESEWQELQRLGAAVACGEDVDEELALSIQANRPVAAAHASLLRAQLADRRGDLSGALRHIDGAMERLMFEGGRTAAAGLVLPALTAGRAYTLAALGRAEESRRELSRLPPDYAHLGRATFTVNLISLVATKDIEGAGRLVAATSDDVSIGARDELVRDLVRAATAPGVTGAAEIGRLRDELREDDETRRWIERVAPELLGRFHRATVDEGMGRETSVDEGSARETAAREAVGRETSVNEGAVDDAAAREAEAEEEAAAHERAARRM